MKSLISFLTESITINEGKYSYEVESIVDILTLGHNFGDKEARNFVQALYEEAEKFDKANYSWMGIKYYFFTNKSKLTKELDQTLRSCECKTPDYEVKFKYRKKDNVKGEDMKEGISTMWDGMDVDKEEVYKDDFGVIYNWESGMYANSKYGEVCIYPNE